MRLVITTLLLLIFLNACQTVQTRVDEKTEAELEKMGQYIGHSLEEVYVDFAKEFSSMTVPR